MSVAMTRHLTAKQAIRQFLPWAGMGLCLTLLAGHFAYDLLGSARLHAALGHPESPAEGKPGPDSPAATPPSASTVSLTESKLKEAGIVTEPARLDQLSTEAGVWGQIQANADRQVEIRPRAGGIVREVDAVLGQYVKRGETLVILDSPEIGKARLDLRQRQRELVTARYEAGWKSEVAANVALLIPELRKGIERRSEAVDDEHHDARPPHEERKRDDTAAIERRFADKQLGVYRGTLLQALAEYDIAAHEEEKTSSLKSQNILGVHPMILALHTRQGVQAKLEGAMEQVRWDAAQEKRLADQAVRQAEAAVIDAAQRLRILGVAEDIPSLLEHPEQANAVAIHEDVTYYRIVAPFDGSIIDRRKFAVPSQKADLNDVLFILADLRSVWVTANVPESDLAKLPKIKGGKIRLEATAYPGREFQAHLLSVGSVVDPQNRTVPVRAQTDNPDGMLKVGMFVRIFLESSTSEPALTVPASAVVEIDGTKYVFAPDGKGLDNRTFYSRRPVEIGRQAGDRIVVKSGLKRGDLVVSAGAFILKSELILQNQPEED
jgi:RND family efflux transporter MFP subunit